MKEHTVRVKNKYVNGMKNPAFSIILEKQIDDIDFEIYVDGIKFDDYEITSLGLSNEVLITGELKTTDKRVELFIVSKKEMISVCILRNTLFFRCFNKGLTTLKKIKAKTKLFFHVLYKAVRFFWREHRFLVPPSMIKKYLKDFKHRMTSANDMFYNPNIDSEYRKWLMKNEIKEEKVELNYQPLISIVIPVYNVKSGILSECLDSILGQSYEKFEVCLTDDCSTMKETKETLEKYEKLDKRIKVHYRKKNGHISKATNDSLSMAKGTFVGFMDNDDLLTVDALYEVVKALNEDKKLDLIYSDEDKMDLKGRRCCPHFKADYSPDTLLSMNYISHFTVVRKRLVDAVGGLEVGLEGAQDYDLYLKITEKTNKIHHIPKILYHWRMVEGSTSVAMDNKGYASDKGKIALENALKRRKILGHVERDDVSTYYRVVYEYKKEPLISLIIPTRDYVDILKTCVDSVYEKTTYKSYEIIIANNESKEAETLDFFEEYKNKYDNFKVVDVNMEFNYSLINNIAVKESSGDYVVLLNNDTEIITPEWLSIMVGYAMQKHIGCVGVKLLYPDTTVQHAGVLLGLGGVASHAYIGEARDALGIYGRLRVPYNYAGNTAACLMINKKKYLEVNGLDPELKVAYNDVDFNIRILEKGYYNVMLPQVELIHYESKSRGLDTTGEKYNRFLIESNLMYSRWEDIINNDPFYNKNYSKKGWFMLDKK